jgi:Domain of unknown function (DUF1707)
MDTLRISDADRAQALDLLSEQYAVGRLDKDEFDERSDAVWSAKTQGDLAPVFVDLPVRSPGLPAHPTGRGTQWGPGWTSGRGPGRGPRRGPPLLALVFLLVLLTILTKVPFVLLLVGLWFVFGWRHHARRHWSHRAGRLR